ncbi:MAG TPA: hypothetical protein DCF44_03680 [Chitinophagaceae bacterium]|nr:hypothetical protein [Chitinophagaceae bacterium]
MIQNKLFSIDILEKHDTGLRAQLSILPDAEILKGHFPGQPVLPGVCQLQIIKEILEMNLGKKLMMFHSPMVKFLTMMAPPHVHQIHCSIQCSRNEAGELQVSATLLQDELIFLKFKGAFKIIE